MDRNKAIVVAILALLAVIVIFQNTESVQTRILFFSIDMPRALLLISTLIVGFVVGIFTGIAKRK